MSLPVHDEQAPPTQRSERASDKVPVRGPRGKLDDYFLLDRLGAGGMAEVFLARASAPASPFVAIKALRREVSTDPAFVRMFQDEARLARTLTHPNIVELYDVGAARGHHYLVMELVRGLDMRRALKHLRRRGLAVPKRVALRVAHDIAQALTYAHVKNDENGRSLGIIHRDVSPHNIMVSFDGAIKLIDFGVAKAATQTELTQAGVIKGKIRYMSPEQLWGQPIDQRVDIYSLGVSLYEMLSGVPVFGDASDIRIFEMARDGDIEPLRDLRPELSDDVIELVEKAMAGDPKDRFSSAFAMRLALERCLGEDPSEVTSEVALWLRSTFPEKRSAWDTLLGTWSGREPTTRGSRPPPSEPDCEASHERPTPFARAAETRQAETELRPVTEDDEEPTVAEAHPFGREEPESTLPIEVEQRPTTPPPPRAEAHARRLAAREPTIRIAGGAAARLTEKEPSRGFRSGWLFGLALAAGILLGGVWFLRPTLFTPQMATLDLRFPEGLAPRLRIDGRPIERGASRVSDLPPGIHHLTVETPDGTTQVHSLSLPRGPSTVVLVPVQ